MVPQILNVTASKNTSNMAPISSKMAHGRGALLSAVTSRTGQRCQFTYRMQEMRVPSGSSACGIASDGKFTNFELFQLYPSSNLFRRSSLRDFCSGSSWVSVCSSVEA